ncbi:Serine/threonine-protein kinase 17A [Cichlidogyrus casuarinus]|uniref:Serine/threonine-protein kinase 17A n=1 Tax=Cichlidogyrus casuarinus TaxID=1844966 RepID=A0ABD2QD71_9PLAT
MTTTAASDDGLIQMFYEIDKDKSGSIEIEELRQYLREKQYEEYFITRFLHVFDTNRDGVIGFDEYTKSLKKIPHEQKLYTKWHEILSKVDKDKNGYITLDEIYAMVTDSGKNEKMSVKELQAFMREYDRDGDGKLNYHEFLDYLLSMNE